MPPEPTPLAEPASPTRPRESVRSHQWLYPLVLRLHFYIGLLIGPLLLIAALSGALYALSPQLENYLYRTVLYTDSRGPALPLQAQIEAAQAVLDSPARLAAVRPAAEPGLTTRVMFAKPQHGPSEHRAIFIDPVTGRVTGDLTVYGTSGVLPFRLWIDYLHRSLHLGEWGRLYSELAASWLWLTALGGTLLMLRRRAPAKRGRWHARVGVALLLGLLFFSVTGLTWSRWAGDHIATLRAQLNWGTPSLNTLLDQVPPPVAEHHHHHAPALPPISLTPDPAQFDTILALARTVGIDSGYVEIRPPVSSNRAWTVTEIDRRWPTQVDGVALNPETGKVVDRTDFNRFPLAAKLTRWGIDAHMGILFGWPNQLLVAAVAMGLCGMVISGYWMWWRRRPSRTQSPRLLFDELKRTPGRALIPLTLTAVLVGWFLPVLGVSLLAFLLIDLLRSSLKK